MLHTSLPNVGEADQDGFASVSDVSRFLGLSKSKVYDLMGSGDLPFAKFGRSRRIPWKAVKDFAARRLSDCCT